MTKITCPRERMVGQNVKTHIGDLLTDLNISLISLENYPKITLTVHFKTYYFLNYLQHLNFTVFFIHKTKNKIKTYLTCSTNIDANMQVIVLDSHLNGSC